MLIQMSCTWCITLQDFQRGLHHVQCTDLLYFILQHVTFECVCGTVQCTCIDVTRAAVSSLFSLLHSSFYWASVTNATNVLQPYWLIVLPLDVPDLTASLLL